MYLTTRLLIVTAISAALFGCEQPTTSQSVDTQAISATDTVEVAQSESEKANELFEKIFTDGVMRSPMFQSYLGITTDQDKWDDLSEANSLKELEISKQNLTLVNKIDAVSYTHLRAHET